MYYSKAVKWAEGIKYPLPFFLTSTAFAETGISMQTNSQFYDIILLINAPKFKNATLYG